LLETCRGFK